MPHRTRHVALAAVVCAAMAMAAGCGTRGPADERPRVALVVKTLNSPFFNDMQRGAEQAAAEAGVRLTVQGAEREVDTERQMQIVENLVQTGVDVLCISPSGSREIVPAIVKANRAGVPVVVVDSRVDQAAAREAGATVVSFIGSDNVEGGRLAGEHLARATGGRARVAILEGIAGHETSDSRLRGFREAIREAPGIEVVASQPANMERDQGFTVLQNLLQAHPTIDAVFACNDVMALGAIEAIAAAGRTGQIRVIGFDAIDDAREAIEAGRMEASIAQFPDEMGRACVETAVQVLSGESVPAERPVRIELVTRASQP